MRTNNDQKQSLFIIHVLIYLAVFFAGVFVGSGITETVEEPPELIPVPGELSDEQELEHAYKLIQTLRATLSAYQNEK